MAPAGGWTLLKPSPAGQGSLLREQGRWGVSPFAPDATCAEL